MAPSNAPHQPAGDVSEAIIALETAALEKWNAGDPDGYLALSAEDVVYFDPYVAQRLDGLDNLKNYYQPIRGQVHVTRYEMSNPKVHAGSDMAVLTFNLVSYANDNVTRWNCTEVYWLEGSQWRIIQTHWSLVKPELKG